MMAALELCIDLRLDFGERRWSSSSISNRLQGKNTGTYDRPTSRQCPSPQSG
jgi:hypothetical protein